MSYTNVQLIYLYYLSNLIQKLFQQITAVIWIQCSQTQIHSLLFYWPSFLQLLQFWLGSKRKTLHAGVVYYRLDALLVSQSSLSKYWRQLMQLITDQRMDALKVSKCNFSQCTISSANTCSHIRKCFIMVQKHNKIWFKMNVKKSWQNNLSGVLTYYNKKASICWQDSARRQFQAGFRGDVGL